MIAEGDLKKTPQLSNAEDLLREITWFEQVVETRLSLFFDQSCIFKNIVEISPPDLEGNSVYSAFVRFYHLSFSERLILILALLPHIFPQKLDVFYSKQSVIDRTFTAFGGLRGTGYKGFLPTGETGVFLLGGKDLAARFKVHHLFDAEHLFKLHEILWLAEPSLNEPFLSGRLLLNEEFIELFTGGNINKPHFGMDFPAKKIETPLIWNDLVLDAQTMQQLDEIRIWLEYGPKLMDDWEMKKKLKPGYKALFHGAPGTGKTLTASLFGKLANVDVYRVDLSMVISKYIGETEKNLEKVFKKAENKNWILFFDEADALFSKRTLISDAHDKYANQEIAYLLQRLEDYNGLVILSSNMRTNVDDAFGRRLQSIIHFPMPKSYERSRLWRNTFSTKTKLEVGLNIDQLSDRYELAGGSILNVVQYASLMALDRKENTIREKDILEGIKKEFKKEGKTM